MNRMKKTASVFLICLITLSLCFGAVGCGKINADPSQLGVSLEIDSIDYDIASSSSEVNITVTIENNSEYNVSFAEFNIAFLNDRSDELGVKRCTYSPNSILRPGESIALPLAFNGEDGERISGSVSKVSLTTTRVSFTSAAFGVYKSPEEKEFFGKLSTVLFVLGLAVALIALLLFFVAKTSDRDVLITVSIVFAALALPLALCGLISKLFGGFWFVVGVVPALAFAVASVFAIAYKNITVRSDIQDKFIVGMFLAPVYFTVSVIAFIMSFPEHILLVLSFAVVILASAVLTLFLLYEWDITVSEVTVLTLFAVGIAFGIVQFTGNIVLSFAIGFGFALAGAAFFMDDYEGGTKIIPPVALGLSVVGIVIGAIHSVWLLFGLLGALLTVSGAAYFLAKVIREDDVYDVPQAVSAVSCEIGLFVTVLSFLSLWLGDVMLACSIAAGAAALLGFSMYLLQFLYTRSYYKRHNTKHMISYYCKKLSSEAISTLDICGIVSSIASIVLATTMLIIKFVFV